jgi:hypothetical protein
MHLKGDPQPALGAALTAALVSLVLAVVVVLVAKGGQGALLVVAAAGRAEVVAQVMAIPVKLAGFSSSGGKNLL